MADPETKPAEAPAPAPAEGGGEAAPAEGAAQPAAASSGGSTLLYIIVGSALLLLPASCWAVAHFILSAKIQKAAAEIKLAHDGGMPGEGEHPAAAHPKEVKKPAGGHGEAEGEADKPLQIFALADVVVNIAGSPSRFLRASMEIDGPKDVQDELKKRQAQVRDIVTSTLSAKRMEELESPTIRKVLRTDLMIQLNVILEKGKVTDIYITDLVIQ